MTLNRKRTMLDFFAKIKRQKLWTTTVVKVKKYRLLRVQLIVQQISLHPLKIPMKVKHPLHQISPAPADRKKQPEKRSFQKRDFKWLKFQEDNNSMSCTLCIKHKKSNALTGGCRNFKTSTLTRHADSKDHKEALLPSQWLVVLRKL